MSSPPGQFDPPSAKKGKPEPVQPIKGLVIPAGTKANPQPVVRHMPFSSSAAGDKGPKYISNEVNSYGSYRVPTMCSNCVSAISNFNETLKLGRGANVSNEFVSCLTHKSYGNGGEQCARCLGLGKGPGCVDIPEELHTEARSIIKRVPDYNRLLKKNAKTNFKDWTNAGDVSLIRKLVKDATMFKSALDAHNSKFPIETPRKKRSAAAAGLDNHALTALSQSSGDLRTEVKHTQTAITTVNAKVRRLQQDVDDMKRMLIVSRERQKWICDVLHQMIEAKVHHPGARNADGEVVGPYLYTVAPFDAGDVDFNTPDDEIVEREEETDDPFPTEE